MIRYYCYEAGHLAPCVEPEASFERVVWIDMISPSLEDEVLIERLMGFNVPTHEDMQEIEMSSRTYDEAGVLFLTAPVLATSRDEKTVSAPVSFVLAGNRLVTVRYHEPHSFVRFVESAARQVQGCSTGQAVLIGLLETIVDRLADILEGQGRVQADISTAVFVPKRSSKTGAKLSDVLLRIGASEETNGMAGESLVAIQRLSGFLTARAVPKQASKAGTQDKVRLKTLLRDIASLQDYAGTQKQKLVFLLDATLGMINIQQSDIIKVFSVVAFVFLPPTLIASIYGMNFHFMPELDWPWGYPLAIGLMVLSAILPYAYFKRKGWM
jgi:magnesium transporter